MFIYKKRFHMTNLPTISCCDFANGVKACGSGRRRLVPKGPLKDTQPGKAPGGFWPPWPRPPNQNLKKFSRPVHGRPYEIRDNFLDGGVMTLWKRDNGGGTDPLIRPAISWGFTVVSFRALLDLMIFRKWVMIEIGLLEGLSTLKVGAFRKLVGKKS